MKLCLRCESGYPDNLTTCPIHGGVLSEIRELRPGLLVRGTYRIVRKLGQGGMGAVYLAEQIFLAEPQVLKFLSKELSQDRELAESFLREVRTLRQIRHKNVVHAGNLEPAEDGTLFFSMEYVDGPDLLTFVRRAPRPFDVPLALSITRGIAEGLGAAHALGMVHRDIKPENILMARDGGEWVPKIADFGIVATRESHRHAVTDASMLTPYFAAPEQWLGAPAAELDGRTDLYALGGVLFEVLTGESAFGATNGEGWDRKHLNAAPRAPSSVLPELAHWKGLDALVLRLLEKDRDRRPRDVAELLSLLNAIVYDPLPADAAPEPPAETAAMSEPAEEIAPSAPTEEIAVPDPPQELPAATDLAAVNASSEDIELPEPQEEIPSFDPPSEPAFIEPEAEEESYVPPKEYVVRAPHADGAGARPTASRTSPQRDPVGPVKQKKKESSRRIPTRIWVGALVLILVAAYLGQRMIVPPVPSTTLEGQNDAVFAVAFSVNGITLASASRDKTILLWDVRDGKQTGTIRDDSESLALSSDGTTLAAGISDNTIKLWDVTNGQVLVTMQGHTGHAVSLAFSPDGRTLASGSADKTILLSDVASGAVLRTFLGHGDQVLSVAFSPDGRMLASGSADHTVMLWDANSGQVVRTLKGHSGAVNSVAFSPNGRMVASASDDHTIKLWDAASGIEQHTLEGHAGAVACVAFSPDGRMVASGSSDNAVKLWDAGNGRLLRTLNGHYAAVLSVAFSPSGFLLASSSADKSIRLWSLANVRN